MYAVPDAWGGPAETEEIVSVPLPSGVFDWPALNSHVDVPAVTMNPYD